MCERELRSTLPCLSTDAEDDVGPGMFVGYPGVASTFTGQEVQVAKQLRGDNIESVINAPIDEVINAMLNLNVSGSRFSMDEIQVLLRRTKRELLEPFQRLQKVVEILGSGMWTITKGDIWTIDHAPERSPEALTATVTADSVNGHGEQFEHVVMDIYTRDLLAHTDLSSPATPEVTEALRYRTVMVRSIFPDVDKYWPREQPTDGRTLQDGNQILWDDEIFPVLQVDSFTPTQYLGVVQDSLKKAMGGSELSDNEMVLIDIVRMMIKGEASWVGYSFSGLLPRP